jgi:hypothetical protein
MADISFHNVKKVWIGVTREYDTYVTRTIHIEDEKGEAHEVTLFSNNVESEDTLKLWL